MKTEERRADRRHPAHVITNLVPSTSLSLDIAWWQFINAQMQFSCSQSCWVCCQLGNMQKWLLTAGSINYRLASINTMTALSPLSNSYLRKMWISSRLGCIVLCPVTPRELFVLGGIANIKPTLHHIMLISHDKVWWPSYLWGGPAGLKPGWERFSWHFRFVQYAKCAFLKDAHCTLL